MQTVIMNTNWRRCHILTKIFALIGVLSLVIGLVSIIFNKGDVEADLTLSQQQAEALHGTNGSIWTTITPTTSRADNYNGTCFTQECVRSASVILSKMKPEIEPCNDFYQFACGGFIDEIMIPDDKEMVNTFSTISDKLDEQLRNILTEERSPTDPKHLRLPNALYKTCMNKTLIENLGMEPIKKISDSLGGWPVIEGDAWDKDDKWTWQETVKNFRKNGLGMDYILDFSIGVDLRNSTKRIITLDQSSLELSREYLIKGPNETLVSAYYNYMVDIAVLFGADRAIAKKELNDSLNFEIKLANISWSQEKRRNPYALYNLRTVKELQTAFPYVQWLDYMNALLPQGLTIEEDELINLSVPSFFDNLGPLLAETPKRVIANYMMWRIHSFSVSFLSKQFRKRQLKYETVLSGKQKREPRWKECVQFASDRMPIALGSLYVQKYFKQDAKVNALEVVDNIHAAFDRLLDKVDWMDYTTKLEAKKKLKAMKTHIGYPDEMLDDNILEEYYHKLDIDPTKYFESLLNVNTFDTNYSFNKLRLPVNKTDWVSHAKPAIVNAFYSALENSIQFPAGILQGHFFNADRPKYLNYGAIGCVIGHEITHGFDDQGREFDVEGNLVDWWQQDTEKAYLKKATCIIEQYGNYTEKITNLTLNGVKTQGENIGDNGGVKVSYNAYRQWAASNEPEPKLPGLEYTPQQMYWISAGQTWCAKYRKESLKMRITTGVHSPPEFRVMGPFTNMKDFSRDFQCREGSPMNPVHKCEVW